MSYGWEDILKNVPTRVLILISWRHKFGSRGGLKYKQNKPLNISTVEHFYEKVFYEMKKFLTCTSEDCKVVGKCEKCWRQQIIGMDKAFWILSKCYYQIFVPSFQSISNILQELECRAFLAPPPPPDPPQFPPQLNSGGIKTQGSRFKA